MADLIEKDALKRKHCDSCVCKSNCIVGSCKIYEARCLIASLPTIEAEPVRYGQWEYDATFGGMRHYHCTNCLSVGEVCLADENQILWFRFCPKCGARMDGDEDYGTAD